MLKKAEYYYGHEVIKGTYGKALGRWVRNLKLWPLFYPSLAGRQSSAHIVYNYALQLEEPNKAIGSLTSTPEPTSKSFAVAQP